MYPKLKLLLPYLAGAIFLLLFLSAFTMFSDMRSPEVIYETGSRKIEGITFSEFFDSLNPLLMGQDIRFSEISPHEPPELKELLAEKNPLLQAKIVRAMAEKYGPRETLRIMLHSGLPFTGETHLLVHETGDIAYEKFGEDALKHCDESFLSACFHGVLINMMGDKGIAGVAKMLEKCQAEGPVIMTQCTHASGHGFLAWSDYKVLNALKLCDKLETFGKDIPIFSCHDGIFMENIFGVHDGAPSPNRMVRGDDSFYPCNAVPEKYQGGCWANQATLMYQLFGGNLRKVAQGCDLVKTPEHQRICYDNFARQIHPLTEGRVDRSIEMCKNATGKWQDSCLISLVSAAFSVGDREKMPYELCLYMTGKGKEECYKRLFELIETHGKSVEDRAKFCGHILEGKKQKQCAENFNLPAVSSSALDGDLLKKIAGEKGIEQAYEYLKANTTDPVRAHDLAHLIGSLAYEYKEQKGVALCDDDFAFGCFHGFFEALLGQNQGTALALARQSCLSLNPGGAVASCIHGIGHGIAAWKNDIGESLHQCDRLSSMDKIYCHDGAFMEFYTGVMENTQKSVEDSWEFCLNLASPYQMQCVRNHTFYLFSRYGENSSTPARCSELAENLRGMCIQSVGLRAAQSPEVNYNLCDSFKNQDDRSYCYVSAAQERTFQRKDDGSKICALLSANWKQRCEDTITFTKSLYAR